MALSTVIVRDIIVSETALVLGDELHVGREPSSPNNTVTLFDAPDRGPFLGTEEDPPTRYDYTAIQIRVRNNRYNKAMEIAEQMVGVLHQRGNEIVGDTFVALIEAIDNPFLLDWDESNRARIVTNYVVQKREDITT